MSRRCWLFLVMVAVYLLLDVSRASGNPLAPSGPAGWAALFAIVALLWLGAEVLIVLAEAAVYYRLLGFSWRQAFFASLWANLISLLGGGLLLAAVGRVFPGYWLQWVLGALIVFGLEPLIVWRLNRTYEHPRRLLATVAIATVVTYSLALLTGGILLFGPLGVLVGIYALGRWIQYAASRGREVAASAPIEPEPAAEPEHE